MMQHWDKYRLPVALVGKSKPGKSRFKISLQYPDATIKGFYKKESDYKVLKWLGAILIWVWIMAILFIDEAIKGYATWHFWLFGFHWYLLSFGAFMFMIILLIMTSEPRKCNGNLFEQKKNKQYFR